MTDTEPPGPEPQADDHPEDLLDLARKGQISSAQLRELRRHLAQCFPCATQVRMANRAEAEIDGKSTPADLHLDRFAVYGALERAKVSRWGPRAWPTQRWIPVGVGLLLVSSGALAGTWWSARHRDAYRGPAAVPVFHVAQAPVRRDAVAAVVDPRGEEAAPPDHVAHRAEGAARHTLRPAPGELFARARVLRLGGDPSGALTIYRRLQRDYADSRESHLSYLVAGRIWLERDRPETATVQFSWYLDTGESGSEEALMGRATALARMGRPSEEAADWKRLLSEHPSSVYANHARKRLDQLGRLPGTLDSAASRP